MNSISKTSKYFNVNLFNKNCFVCLIIFCYIFGTRNKLIENIIVFCVVYLMTKLNKDFHMPFNELFSKDYFSHITNSKL